MRGSVFGGASLGYLCARCRCGLVPDLGGQRELHASPRTLTHHLLHLEGC